jgi:hypothetical protein
VLVLGSPQSVDSSIVGRTVDHRSYIGRNSNLKSSAINSTRIYIAITAAQQRSNLQPDTPPAVPNPSPQSTNKRDHRPKNQWTRSTTSQSPTPTPTRLTFQRLHTVPRPPLQHHPTTPPPPCRRKQRPAVPQPQTITATPHPSTPSARAR